MLLVCCPLAGVFLFPWQYFNWSILGELQQLNSFGAFPSLPNYPVLGEQLPSENSEVQHLWTPREVLAERPMAFFQD